MDFDRDWKTKKLSDDLINDWSERLQLMYVDRQYLDDRMRLLTRELEAAKLLVDHFKKEEAQGTQFR